MSVGISFEEMLAWSDEASNYWKNHFDMNPAALELPCDIGPAKNVQGFLRHIWAAELRWAQRLAGLPCWAGTMRQLARWMPYFYYTGKRRKFTGICSRRRQRNGTRRMRWSLTGCPRSCVNPLAARLQRTPYSQPAPLGTVGHAAAPGRFPFHLPRRSDLQSCAEVVCGEPFCCFWKQDRHKTGRPCVGLNGTVVSVPHSEQVVRVSGRTRVDPRARLALHCLQCLGSFLNCLSLKKVCSPAVKMNSAPQSAHFKTRSWNSMLAGFP